MPDKKNNPMGTDGFEFIEYTATDTRVLTDLFHKLGFCRIAHHRSKAVDLFRQGNVNFIINHEPDSFAREFAHRHGPSACAFAIRVKNAGVAYERALKLGARPFLSHVGPMELNIPAIYGIGGSVLYLVDRYRDNSADVDDSIDHSIYEVDFKRLGNADATVNVRNRNETGIQTIDHLTHNVRFGRMDKWASFYEKLFNFREIRYFNIKGLKTGLHSRALLSPCGKIRIPINEPSDKHSQIEEFISAYQGEGIQHIALATDNIYQTVEKLRSNGITFLQMPDSYYEMINDRLPGHHENIRRMRQNGILIDGSIDGKECLLLQIFTQNVIGPIFFEIIQRKGNQGFGEGNFQALFESIERNQQRRGVLV